jgi:DNA primase
MLYHEINKLKKNEKEKAFTRSSKATDTVPPPQFEEMVGGEAVVSKFDNEERAILQLLIKYGQNIMYYADKDETQGVTVASYVFEELEHDNLVLFNRLHQRVFDEYKVHCSEEKFSSERFFLYHPEEQISQLAADLITDRYTLSKVHSKVKKIETDIDRLIDLVPRVIFEFKNSYIIDLIRTKLLELKVASEAKDNMRADEIMREMADLEAVKRQLSKSLGERIILKI